LGTPKYVFFFPNAYPPTAGYEDGEPMPEPNDVLREEHEAIEHLVSVLEHMAGQMHRKRVPEGDLEKAMAVAVEFADRCHHAKEEKVLFPALSKASPKTGAEIARRLTSDHVAFRKLVGDTRKLIPRMGEGAARTQLSKNLDTYARLLREHIRVEHEQLFPEVERSLGPADRARLAEEFDRVEAEEIGLGVHEKYHSVIEQLSRTYA
jgi:hemerythrin-like domain-containing protein